MIKVTRINGKELYISPHQIECMESTPDTIITLLSGAKFIVREQVDDIIEQIIRYRQEINRGISEKLQQG